MAKRRRTRAQKERAAQHRQQLTQQNSIQADQKDEIDKHKLFTDKTVEQSTTVIEKSVVWNPQQKQGLKLSLTLLAFLLAIQLLIWLIFGSTDLDTKLYDLIKL